MNEHAAGDLPREGDDERHDDKEHGVLHCAIGLDVDVDRLDECDAK